MAVQNVGYLFQKGLTKVLFLAYKEEPSVADTLINTQTVGKEPYIEMSHLTSVGSPEVKARQESMVYKDLIMHKPKRVTWQVRALGMRLPFEDLQDDQTGHLKKLAEAIGRSQKIAQEYLKMNFFNGAFGTWWLTGYDDKALCDTDHTIDGEGAYSYDTTDITSEPTRSIKTWANRPSADIDLDYTALQDMKVLLRRTLTPEGNFMNLAPRTLLVPPELEDLAYELTKSQMRPDTANRAESSVYAYNLKVVSTPYLLDTDAWFILSDRNDLNYYLKMPLTIKKYDTMQGSWDMAVESAIRDGVGFYDPRGIVGTSGA